MNVRNYAHWVEKRRGIILLASAVLFVVAGWLASHLDIRAEFSNLLPPSKQSVRDLNQLKGRIRAFGTVFVVVEGQSPEQVKRAARTLKSSADAIDPSLVAHVADDDRDIKDFYWKYRFLFVELSELERARDTLAQEIRDAKLDANPLFVDLEDEDEDEDTATKDSPNARDELVDKFEKAESRYRARSRYEADDGRTRLLTVRTTAPTSDFQVGKAVLSQLKAIARQVEKDNPSVRIGFTGTTTASLIEHDSIMQGVLLAGLITLIAIAIALLLYYKSVLGVAAALWSLAVGVVITFAVAYFLIGHLNIMTAFLVAIVAGNGINSSLILLSRYFEELRAGGDDTTSLASSIAGAARGTLAASVAAGVAYGALIVTDFRGFRHFGVIGCIGMFLCWLTAFSVLPAGLSWLRARNRLRVYPRPPAVARVVALFAPKRPLIVAFIGVGVASVAVAITAWYIANDPLEKDWRRLRADNAELRETKRLDAVMRNKLDASFGAGLSSRFVVATPSRAQTQAAAEILRDAPPSLLSSVTSYDGQLLPIQQTEKLRVLGEISDLLTDDALAQFDDDDRKLIERLRPPPGLRQLTDADIPSELSWPFIEVDGSIGRIILVSGSRRFTTWDTDHRVALASGVRELPLPEGAVLGGQSFVIADIIESMERDGPLTSLVALLGAVAIVTVLVGFGIHAGITLLVGAIGMLIMVALCALVGLRINFLDLIAVPITIGIGIDYAVNLAVRHRQDDLEPAELLGTTGGAVLLCSFTTIVGYGSLLLSENAGIRSFGLAAILGEVACIAAAVLLVPALLALWTRRAVLNEASQKPV